MQTVRLERQYFQILFPIEQITIRIMFRSRIIRCLLIGSLWFPTMSLSQWYEQTAPPTRELTDVIFVNANVGWAVGIDSAIFYTSNGGDSWKRQHVDGPLGRLTGVFPLTENTCWIVGWDTILLRTTDGGGNWERRTYTGIEFDTTWFADGVYFTDSMKGWVSGYYFNASFLEGNFIVATTDGGQTWNRQSIPQQCLGTVLDAVDPMTAWLCCDEYLLGTTDGSVWSTKHRITSNLVFYDVDFVTSQTGWSVREVYPAGAIVARSDDGGSTWTQQLYFAFSGGYTYISFIDSLRGWVASSSSTELEILYTQDGGGTWTEQFSGSGFGNPQRVYFSDSVNGWVVTDAGKILHTSNGGITSIEEGWISEGEVRAVVYPNPFNSTTQLIYRLGVGSDVHVSVYDLLGRKVFEHNEANQHPGKHGLKIDFKEMSINLDKKLPSGIYFCRLTLENTVLLLPIVFLR